MFPFPDEEFRKVVVQIVIETLYIQIIGVFDVAVINLLIDGQGLRREQRVAVAGSTVRAGEDIVIGSRRVDQAVVVLNIKNRIGGFSLIIKIYPVCPRRKFYLGGLFRGNAVLL